jgi:hypothetical protein
MNLHINKFADRMDEKREAGQNTDGHTDGRAGLGKVEVIGEGI